MQLADPDRQSSLGNAEIDAITLNPVGEGDRRFREMIDALPAAVYTTDAEGRLTHYNPAAVELTGRRPELGRDRWCVSWKLYLPDGTPLPHDEFPMAIAIKEGRAIRGAEMIAERPDGTRVWVAPYPTPLRDAAAAMGRVAEAVRGVRAKGLPEDYRIRVSIGLTAHHLAERAEDAVSRADAALLEAKRAGRDRVVTSE